MSELQRPETDQEHVLCWRVFNNAADNTTQVELRERMSSALADYRARRRRRTENFTKGSH
jgi:hypothetical protein